MCNCNNCGKKCWACMMLELNWMTSSALNHLKCSNFILMYLIKPTMKRNSTYRHSCREKFYFSFLPMTITSCNKCVCVCKFIQQTQQQSARGDSLITDKIIHEINTRRKSVKNIMCRLTACLLVTSLLTSITSAPINKVLETCRKDAHSPFSWALIISLFLSCF